MGSDQIRLASETEAKAARPPRAKAGRLPDSSRHYAPHRAGVDSAEAPQ
jgi:hypothetical protein